jgi:hypothetical protein
LTPRFGMIGFAVGYCTPMVIGNGVVLFILKSLVPDAHLWPRTRALLAGCVAEALLGRFVLLGVCNGPISFPLGVVACLLVFLAVVGLLDRTAIHEIVSLVKSNVPKPEAP